MGWERGRYYTRSVREGGKVRREYVGTGKLAELAAQMDAIFRAQRQQQRAEERAEREELDALDAPLAELDDLADLLVRAALTAAGYHRHHRGEWRKRRDGNHDGKDGTAS